jgi:hypothetical protein
MNPNINMEMIEKQPEKPWNLNLKKKEIDKLTIKFLFENKFILFLYFVIFIQYNKYGFVYRYK